jgi:predicted lipoprotein with Yx(FWY)xxD motif
MRHSTVHIARAALAAGALALVVAGCGSGDGGSSGNTGTGDGIVSVASVDGNDALVDGDGQTLYSANVETGGQIRCVDACTSFWEPLIATASQANQASADLNERFAVVDRPDGESQLTYKGLPLYTFAEEGSGELKGDGFTDDFQGTHFEWSAAWTDAPAVSDTPDDSGGGYGY